MQQMKFADAHSGDVLQTGRRQADDDKSTTYKDPYLADEDDVPRNGLDLTDEQRERREKAKLVQGRRELLRIFWHENRDVLWSIDPSLKGLSVRDSVDHLLRECDSAYEGNFAAMIRNLRHDAMNVHLRSSVQAQMVLRPSTTRVGSVEMDGYQTARRKQEERLTRVYSQRQGCNSNRDYDFTRKKGTEYAVRTVKFRLVACRVVLTSWLGETALLIAPLGSCLCSMETCLVGALPESDIAVLASAQLASTRLASESFWVRDHGRR